MSVFYKKIKQSMDATSAILCFIFVNIIFWFFIGALAGIFMAILFPGRNTVFSCAVTLGSCLALSLGYVKGSVVVMKNS